MSIRLSSVTVPSPTVRRAADGALARYAPPGGAKLDFARLVGDGWNRLVPDIRERFSEKPEPDAPIRYVGIMATVACSRLGLALAQICRVLGTPFAPWRGRDVPVAITLRAVPDEEAIIWDREYCYPRYGAVLVRSIKRTDDRGGLLECVGGGFGMWLDVYEQDGALHFHSRRYFWRCAGRLLPWPKLLAPGATHVVHEDLGEGNFRFLMTIRHRLFGTLFHQDGVFHRDQPQA